MEDYSDFIPKQCKGEKCFCGEEAYRKVAEVITDDDPLKARHELTAYVCQKHWHMIMG